MKFTIKNLGIPTVNASSSTEFAISPIPHNGTQVVADLTKDELVNSYNVSGNTVISVIGTTGAEDYDAPIYTEITATTTWTLYDIGAYRVKWTLFNLSSTQDVYVSFSGYSGTTGALSLVVNATAKTFTRATGSFLNDGFIVGRTFTATGFANAGNNSTFTITSATNLTITCSAAVGLVNETHSATLTMASAPTDNGIIVARIPAAGTRLSHYGLNIDRTMNPERYIFVKSSGATPVLQVLAV